MASAFSPQTVAQVGDVIAGKFRIERVLGEGGMGVVVEATHLLLDERVALKFLRPQVMLQPDLVARFAQEARAAAKLKSEHVARVLDVGEDQSMPYIVMEYLQGKDLQALIAERGAFPTVEAVDLLIQAAEGMSEAHARGIVHRDLKPANLFLAQRADGWNTLKVLDFGISKAALSSGLADVPAGPGKTMSLLGSPYYMSPEQLRSTRDVDRRTDIWALGAVLFELLTGQTAFSATDFLPLVNEILERPHTSLRLLCPAAPPELEALIDRALAKDPADRFQSAGELALALLPFTKSNRSRVIATHAITLTRSSGIDATLMLPSAMPPPMSADPMGSAAPGSGPLRMPPANAISFGLDGAPTPFADRRSGLQTSNPLAETALVVPDVLPHMAAAATGASPAASGTTLEPSIKRANVALLLGALGLMALIGVALLLAARHRNVAPMASPVGSPATTMAIPLSTSAMPSATITTTEITTPSATSDANATAAAGADTSAVPVAAKRAANGARGSTLPAASARRPAPIAGDSASPRPSGDLDIRRER